MQYRRLLIVCVHLSSWLLLFITPLLFPPELPEYSRLPTGLPRGILIVSAFFVTGLFFYGNLYVLIPRVWRRYNHWYYLGALFVVVGGLHRAYLLWRNWWLLQDFNPNNGAYGLLLLFFVSWVVSSGLWLLGEWQRTNQRLKQSEYQKTQAELNQLKGQLNPHFLFNTLHGIYALALERDARAPDAILQLSKLLDYSLTGPDQHFVNLQDDIDHLQDYIELNQLRLSPKTTLEVDLVGNYTAHTVAPFLLLPFVENAFKYGVSTAVASRIVISATVSQQRLHFTCRNRRFAGRSSGKGHAIGIENVRRRLMLLYPQRHELSLQQSKTHYEVTLTIDLAHEVVASATTIPVS